MSRDDGRREDPSLLPLVRATPGVPAPTATGSDRVPSVLPLVDGTGTTPSAPEVPSLLPNPDGAAADARIRVAAPEPSAAPAASPSAKESARLEALAPAVSTGDWPTVLETLGSPESAASLPPALGLVYAVAQKEAEVPISEADRDRADPTRIAIRAMAALLGVAEHSPLALVLAKRLLRANPVSWRQRKAPPVGTSILIVLVGLLLGLAAGYVISVGHVQINLPTFR